MAGPSREWLERAADAEDAVGGITSVGGLAADLGMLGEGSRAKSEDEMRDLLSQALEIIAEAIVRGMPVTQKVADVRNEICRVLVPPQEP
jgi:hypothetical protein